MDIKESLLFQELFKYYNLPYELDNYGWIRSSQDPSIYKAIDSKEVTINCPREPSIEFIQPMGKLKSYELECPDCNPPKIPPKLNNFEDYKYKFKR